MTPSLFGRQMEAALQVVTQRTKNLKKQEMPRLDDPFTDRKPSGSCPAGGDQAQRKPDKAQDPQPG